MRKFVWAGIAVVVLGAVGVYVAADFTAHHPDSWFGRCTALAGYLGSKCNAFAGIGTAVAQHSSGDGVEQCEPVHKNKLDGVEEALNADGLFDVGAEPDEPIKVEPQPDFIVPADAAPATEFPERVDPAEESEAPTDVAAPAHAEEGTTPPTMSYVEDEAPACKKCGTCAAGCCDKGTCAKECTKKTCCELSTCAKNSCDKVTCTKGCCDQGSCAKEGCTKTGCSKACCEQATCGKKKCQYVIFGITIDLDADQTGSSGSKPCCPVGCCVHGCCDWLSNLLGLGDCTHCPGCKPAPGKPVSSDCDADSDLGETPAPAKPTHHSRDTDDVPNCQEDPTYSRQYPGSPYTGAPDGVCPCYPSDRQSTKDSPLNELMPSKKKAKKPSLNSVLNLVPPSYGSMLDPLFLGMPGTRVISALRAVTGTASEDCGVNQEIDTMEARPSDVEKFSDIPF